MLYILTEGLPRRGYRPQPRVSTLGIFKINGFALTRRYLVAPCWKNTRSAGLEVLKGREMRVPDEARTCCRAKVRVRSWNVRQLDHRTRFRLVRTFDLAPPSERVALGAGFPGLKPWAEFCSPFGAQNEGLNPRIVAYSSFGATLRQLFPS